MTEAQSSLSFERTPYENWVIWGMVLHAPTWTLRRRISTVGNWRREMARVASGVVLRRAVLFSFVVSCCFCLISPRYVKKTGQSLTRKPNCRTTGSDYPGCHKGLAAKVRLNDLVL
jgi:hypothetical protein